MFERTYPMVIILKLKIYFKFHKAKYQTLCALQNINIIITFNFFLQRNLVFIYTVYVLDE
jgi:hypothetical protein